MNKTNEYKYSGTISTASNWNGRLEYGEDEYTIVAVNCPNCGHACYATECCACGQTLNEVLDLPKNKYHNIVEGTNDE